MVRDRGHPEEGPTWVQAGLFTYTKVVGLAAAGTGHRPFPGELRAQAGRQADEGYACNSKPWREKML